MRIAHYYATALMEKSGVTAAIDAWSNALIAAGASVEVWTAPGPLATTDVFTVPTRVVPHRGHSRNTFRVRGEPFRRALEDVDLLVLHEGWSPSHVFAARSARKAGVPYVVMPHGVYEPDIINGLRLSGARSLAERYVLGGCAAVHVFFDTEVPLAERYAPKVRTIVSPTGYSGSVRTGPCTRQGGDVVWYGRMHVHHKGVDLLLEGLSQVDPAQRPHVAIAGYDYRGGLAEIRALIGRLGLEQDVTVRGRLDGPQISEFLDAGKVYVHPSRWECHSIAFLEALASGIPVYASEDIQIAGLAREAAGIRLVPSTAEGWRDALREIGSGPVSQPDRADFFGRFTWPAVAEETLGAYRALCETSEEPGRAPAGQQ